MPASRTAPTSLPNGVDAFVHTDEASRTEVAGSRGPVWILPLAVARPTRTEQVAALIEWSATEGLALVPRGGATGMPGGNVGDGIVVDLTALDAAAWDPAGLVRAGAGAVAASVDDLARRHAMHFPALPSSAPWCSVGGMVATDAAGARSFRHGATHAFVESLEVVHASGGVERLVRGAEAGHPVWGRTLAQLTTRPLPHGPAVRKNSSGYAVDRYRSSREPIDLLAGSEGTLAFITEVGLRPVPLPQHRGVALLGVGDLSELPSLVEAARHGGGSACEYFGVRLLDLGGLIGDPRLEGLDTTSGALLVEFAGTAEHVRDGLRALSRGARTGGGIRTATAPAEAEALWTLRHGASPAIAHAAGRRRSVQFIEDCVVPVRHLAVFVDGIERAVARQGWEAVIFGHAGDGNLHVNPLVDLFDPQWREKVFAILDEVVDLVASLGGTLSGEHGDGRIRAPFLDRIWSSEHVRAFHDVKAAFDPLGMLNPGVILPEAAQDPLRGFAAGPDLQRLASDPPSPGQPGHR